MSEAHEFVAHQLCIDAEERVLSVGQFARDRRLHPDIPPGRHARDDVVHGCGRVYMDVTGSYQPLCELTGLLPEGRSTWQPNAN